jgi:hypothetical protein
MRRAAWQTDLVSDGSADQIPFHHDSIDRVATHIGLTERCCNAKVAATQSKARMRAKFHHQRFYLAVAYMCVAESNRIIPVATIDFHFPLGCTNEARIFTLFPNDGVRH